MHSFLSLIDCVLCSQILRANLKKAIPEFGEEDPWHPGRTKKPGSFEHIFMTLWASDENVWLRQVVEWIEKTPLKKSPLSKVKGSKMRYIYDCVHSVGLQIGTSHSSPSSVHVLEEHPGKMYSGLARNES